MVDGLAHSAESALAHAGVHALGVDAGPILGAVRAERALRATALGQRITKESGLALAYGLVVLYSTYGVGSAGRRVAGIHGRWRGQHTRALDKGVARVTCGAGADRYVVVHAANGLQAAHSRAGILALAPNTSLVGRALGVAHALGATALVGIAYVLRLAALADVVFALHPAQGIGAAWRGVARVLGSRWWGGYIWKRWVYSYVRMGFRLYS